MLTIRFIFSRRPPPQLALRLQIATLIKEKDALVHELAESKASAERFAEKADGLTKQVESLSNSNSIAAGHTTVNGKDADAGGVPPAPHVAADLKDEGSDVAVQLDKLALEKQALVKDLEMAKKKFLAVRAFVKGCASGEGVGCVV